MEDKLLIDNTVKKAKKTQERDIITYTNFLDPRELNLVIKELIKQKYKYQIIRVNEEVEKCIIMFLPTYLKLEYIDMNEYISCIKISIKKGQKLKHKDYMGAIYNMGVKREYIGDIFVYEDNSACIFCTPKIAEYFKYNLINVGKYEVQVDIKKIEEIEMPKKLFEKFEIIVPSNRLDNIVTEIIKISRNKAIEKIAAKEVFVNYEENTNKSLTLKEKDIISIRGTGKYKVDSFLGETKKGNQIISIKKYS